MKKITRLWQLMLLLVLTSSVAFAQSYNLGTTKSKTLTDVQLKQMKIAQEQEQVLEQNKTIAYRGDERGITLSQPSYSTKGADCPAGSVWGLPLTGFSTGVVSDVDPGYKSYQKVTGSFDVTDIHWWGIHYYFDGSSWSACSEDPMDFVVAVYDDNAGVPGTQIATYSANLTGVDSGETFSGAPIWEYTMNLTGGPLTIDNKWISIFADPGGDANCWFLWVNSGTAATDMQQEDLSTNTFSSNSYSMSMCLIGSMTYANDLMVTGVTAPVDGVLSATESVTIEINNNGSSDQTNFPLSFTFEGNTYNENYAGTLVAGASDSFTFTQTIDCSTVGSYSLDACVNLAGDEDNTNDCYTHNFESTAPGLCVDGLYTTGCSWGDGLITWDLADVNGLSIGCDGPTYDWYHDWTSTYTHNMQQSVSYTLTAQAGYSSTYLRVWIDFNDDLVLDAGELLVDNFLLSNSNVDYNIPISIPPTANLGTHILRYRTNWSAAMTGDGCETLTYGNMADFGVNISTAPACISPSGLTVGSITTNSAVLSWTENGSATTWDIEYGLTGFAPTGAPSFSTTHNPHTLTGLTAATTYDWYIRADCGGGDYSSWSGVNTFTTACGTITTFPALEDFESGVFSNCWAQDAADDFDWTVLSGGTPSGSTGPSSGADGTTYYIYTETSSPVSNSDVAIIYSPDYDLTASTNPQLHFFNHMYGAGMDPDGGLDIAITSDGGATYTSIWSQTGDQGDQWNEATVLLTAYSANTVRFRITATVSSSGTTYQNDFAIDEFSVEEAPSCPNPTDLAAANVTSTTADLEWTSYSGSSNIEYGLAGFTLGTDPIGTASAVASPYGVSGLTATTDYEFYVQDDCGGGDLSAWVGPFAFTTPCDMFIPAGAILESEVCGDDDNGGCIMPAGTETWEPVNAGDIIHGTFWADGGNRDTDWYEITIAQPSTITITGDAESPIDFYELTTATQGVPDCGSVAVGLTATVGPCSAGGFTTELLPAGTYWFWAGSTSFDGFPCTQNYWIEFIVTPVYDISGSLMYANAANTQLDHSVATLTDAVPTDFDFNTMCDGAFLFSAGDGTYSLTGSTTKEWGGLSIVDGIFAQRFIAGLYPLSPLQQVAADVSQSGAPSVVDIIMIKRRIAGLTYPAWNAPDYVFETNTVTIAGANVSQDVFALCSGDVNGSFTPPATNPMPTNLAVTEISATEYDLSWDGSGTSDLEWGPIGFTPGDGTGTFVAGAVSPYNVSGLTAGNSYDFYVRDYSCGSATPSAWAGPATFPPPPPANNDCANAEAIGEVIDYAFNTAYATTSGVDAHSVNQDIWYAYTPAADGTIDVDLCGSSYDTKLVVYDGSCGTLNELGYNDDDCGLQSTVPGIAVTAGTTYLIQVGGYGTASGSGDLTITLY